MKHRFAIFCESATIDSESNNVSLINVIDQIQLKGPPDQSPPEEAVIPFSGSLVVLTERSDLDVPESGNGRIALRTPDNREFRSATFVADLSIHFRVRTVLRLNVFPYAGPGIYHFEVAQEDEESGTWTVVDKVPVVVQVDDEATTAESLSDT